LLEAAAAWRPGAVGLLMTLGNTYPWNRKEGAEERVRWFQAAVAADPSKAAAHTNLGLVLYHRKDLAGAEAAYREALRLDPQYATAHNGLGNVLRERKNLAGAEAACREALRLDPQDAWAHNNLGLVLYDRKDLAGAEAACREALRLDPQLAWAHNNLGNVLRARKDLAGAEASYREALRLDPQLFWAHIALGNVLRDRQDLAGAEAALREALRLDPQLAWVHQALGDVLRDRQDLVGAEAAFRKAIRLDAQFVWAHNNLGEVLWERKDLAGAEAAFREAIRLDPQLARSHGGLGWVLQLKGDLEGAITQYKEAHRLKGPQALANLRRAEQMRQVLPRLAEVQGGKAEPENPAQACALAWLCAQPFQQRYALATRLFDRAFRADPQLAADLKAANRYCAATSAVLAAGGEGKDPPKDAPARTALRQQGQGWLRADLILRRKQAASADADLRGDAAWNLNYWLTDPDLAWVREPGRLAALPAVERAGWEKLWADVRAPLAEARKPAPPPGTGAGKK
jgi:tetratricopeptide (TPR) repeat protein